MNFSVLLFMGSFFWRFAGRAMEIFSPNPLWEDFFFLVEPLAK